MHRQDGENTDHIYEIPDVGDTIGKDSPERKSPELTGSGCVKIRSSRAAVVCLVLLCVLLLTAVIVLGVTLAQERQQNINLTHEREQLRNEFLNLDEWIYFQFSFYYLSTEKMNWDNSRQDCQKRGADLIIINTREEYDFVKKIADKREFWIGVTDKKVEGSWRWVGGSNMTSRFWAFGEPFGLIIENCVVTFLTTWPFLGWTDVRCDGAYQRICEKRIYPLHGPWNIIK